MATIVKFGVFELDTEGERLLKNGRKVRMQPQPFKLLSLLATEPGRIVTREEIRSALWKDDTFVDFDQGVNFAIRQVRDALGDDADTPLFIETVPKRGYRFLAPVDGLGPPATPEARATDLRLHKALWANIVEMRLAEEHRKKQRRTLMVALAITAAVIVLAAAVWLIRSR
ncbi:MAG: winged helix-turn-helix domain-containing protein [Vicinamibacterales bacterium]